MQTNPEFKKDRIEHRCPRCRLLLAVESEGQIHVHIKDQCHFIVLGGAMTAACRRCGELHEIVPKMRREISDARHAR